MGIKKFSEIFDFETNYDADRDVWKNFAGKKIAVDAKYELNRAMKGVKSIYTLTDKDGNPTIHIKVIYSNVVKRRSHGIEEIWVFDNSGGNIFKEEEIKIRRETRARNMERLKNLQLEDEDDTQLFDSIEKSVTQPKDLQVDDVKYLLNCLGIKWCEAPKDVEAEQVCAELTISGGYDYVLTNDFDAIAFGAKAVIVRHDYQAKTRNGTDKKEVSYRIYEPAKILESYNLTKHDLAVIGVILGSDWGLKTKGIGPKTVLKKYKSVALTPQQEKGVEIFLSTVDLSEVEIHRPKVDKDAFVDWVVNDKGFKEALVLKQLKGYE